MVLHTEYWCDIDSRNSMFRWGGMKTYGAVGARTASMSDGEGAELLQLLARFGSGDEPLEAVRRLEDRLARTGRGDEGSREQIRNALKVRTLLEDYDHRSRLLEALFDTASDLTDVRDLNLMLRSICCRTRELLGTADAWVSVVDPTCSPSYLRNVEGTRAPIGGQVPDAGGFAGLVVTSGAPRWTTDYLRDTRFEHYELGDAWRPQDRT